MQKNHYQPLVSGESSSETSFFVNFAALLIGVFALAACRLCGKIDFTYQFILFSVVVALSVAVFEYIFYPKTSALRQWRVLRKINRKRVFYKEVALIVTFAAIAFLYFLLPMYQTKMFFDYFPFLHVVVPFLLVASFPYFCLMEKIDPEPDDIYFKIGYAVTHLKKTITAFEFGNYVRSWLIKAFWLALMEPQMLEKIIWFDRFDWHEVVSHPEALYWSLYFVCFFIDLTYASVGYIMNFKILNTQTRTAEPTFLGWFAAIMCYWPFWGILFYNYFFGYGDAYAWMNVFETGGAMWWLWGAIILFLDFLYAMATVSAGIRFSNLTYRGLWRTGLYRITKHPAYVFKNLSWWFVALPLFNADAVTAVRSFFLLLCVNMIYYVRARTEERHLSHYPEYEKYALEMNEKSIFRGLAKVLPFLKYKPLRPEDRLF